MPTVVTSQLIFTRVKYIYYIIKLTIVKILTTINRHSTIFFFWKQRGTYWKDVKRVALCLLPAEVEWRHSAMNTIIDCKHYSKSTLCIEKYKIIWVDKRNSLSSDVVDVRLFPQNVLFAIFCLRNVLEWN